MITIYHNPRCSKSRQGLEILEKSGKEFVIVKYLEKPPTVSELKTILKKLDLSPGQLLRKNEPVWKEKFKGKTLSDDQLIQAMATYPKLIERPIVIMGDKAVVGRPPEIIDTLIN